MSPSAIFTAAVKKPTPTERSAYLHDACRDDPELRRQVEELLRQHDQAGSFLESQPAGLTGAYAGPGEGAGTVVVGRYKLLQVIGEGGMGVVYMAEQTEPVRRRVALKIIKPGMDSAQVTARFEAERQALAIMDHTNIARVFDGGTTAEGRPFFVMELVPGVPITTFCDEQRLTPRERLELFVPVCQAIQHAHQKGIIHRDVKPSNVLVTMYDDRPVPKVIDFGVAKAVEQRLTNKTLFTQFGTMVGTFEYMSPEQAAMNALGVDTRSDIYSLGVLLYEMLTGTTPLGRKRLRSAAFDELLRLIKEEEPPRPSTRLSTTEGLAAIAAARRTDPAKLSRLVRGEVDWIVMKCLEKDRTRRYETVNGLARDVERYLHDEAVEACPPSAGYKLKKLARKHRAGLATAAALAGLLVAGAAVSTVQAVRATRAEQTALAERDRATEAEADATRERDAAVTERARADQEAAVAKAVSDFLQHDLLGQADVRNQPGGEDGRDADVTVRTLLDRAARTLDGKFPDQPLTEAAIRLTMGDAYGGLDRLDESRRHLERSAHLRAARLGADHPDTLESKHALARADQRLGRYDRAEALIREVIQARTARLGADHPLTLASQDTLASMYNAQGKDDQAETLLCESVRAGTARLGADHPQVLDIKITLANLYLRLGRRDRAEPLLQEVVQGLTDQLGADHPRTMNSKSRLGRLYRLAGQYDRAEPLLRELVRAQTTALGAGRPSLLMSMDELAVLYRKHGQSDRADAVWQAMVDQYRQHRPQSNDLGWVLFGMGQYLVRQGRPVEAEELLCEGLARLEKKKPGDRTTFVMRSEFGGALLDLKNYTGAEPLLLDGYEGVKQRLAEFPPALREKKLTDALERLVRLYEAWGKPDEATRWRTVLEAVKGAVKPPAKP